jgi:hypothetical protein
MTPIFYATLTNRKKIMPNLILTINPAIFAATLTALVTIVFTFAFGRILDHALNKNLKTLQEMMAIRKEIDSTSDDAKAMDEIISYRRKRYLDRQIRSFEDMKKEDRKETAKAILREDSRFRTLWWKITSRQIFLGICASVALLVACACSAIKVAEWLEPLL